MLIDPYGLTTMEDVEECGIETSAAFGRSFVHPFDALYADSGHLLQFGNDIYNGDFSRISSSSAKDIVKFGCARAGEIAGMAAAILPIGEAANIVFRGGMSVLKHTYAQVVTRVAQQAAKEGGANFTASGGVLATAERAAGKSLIRGGERTVSIAKAGGQSERLASDPAGYSMEWRGCRSYQFEPAKFQPLRNASTNIQGREYSGHAIDQMQNRGLPFSVIEHAITNGKSVPSSRSVARNIYFDQENNVSVVVQRDVGKVVTVCHGELKYRG